jgi:hypothetical protein
MQSAIPHPGRQFTALCAGLALRALMIAMAGAALLLGVASAGGA